VKTIKARRKPAQVEAVQLTKDVNWPKVARWCGGEINTAIRVVDSDDGRAGSRYRYIRVPVSGGGKDNAYERSPAIHGVGSDFYPVKPDVFHATYEIVDG
jgi:hypothetical protein